MAQSVSIFNTTALKNYSYKNTHALLVWPFKVINDDNDDDDNDNNKNDIVYAAIIYGTTIGRVHSVYLVNAAQR